MPKYKVNFNADEQGETRETRIDAMDQEMYRIIKGEHTDVYANNPQGTPPTEYKLFDRNAPLRGYLELGLPSFNPVLRPESENLMVWKEDGIGGGKFVFLQDYLHDRLMERMQDIPDHVVDGWKRNENGDIISGWTFKGSKQMNDLLVDDYLDLMKKGRVMVNGGTKDFVPRAVHYDPDTETVSTIPLTNEGRETPKPWFMGLGFVTNFITFVSNSANAKKEQYEKDQAREKAVLDFYTQDHVKAEMSHVISEHGKDIASEAKPAGEMTVEGYPKWQRTRARAAQRQQYIQDEKDLENGIRKPGHEIKDPEMDELVAELLNNNARENSDIEDEIANNDAENEKELKDIKDELEKKEDQVELTAEELKELGVDGKEPLTAPEKKEPEVKATEKKEPEKKAPISPLMEAEQGAMRVMKERVMKSDEQETRVNAFFAADIPLSEEKKQQIKILDNELAAINLCCALSAPFTPNTRVSRELEANGAKPTENLLYVTNGIFDVALSEKGTKREKYGAEVQSIANTAIADGKYIGTTLVDDYVKSGNTKHLSRHLGNGLAAMCQKLEMATPDEINGPSDSFMMAARGIQSTMNYLDRNPELKKRIKLNDATMNACKGWQSYMEIHNNAIEQQRDLVSGKQCDPEKLLLTVAQEQNIRDACASGAKTENPKAATAETFWENTKLQSAQLTGKSHVFIQAIGENAKEAEKAKVAPEWDAKDLNSTQIAQHIVEELPKQLAQNPVKIELPKAKKTLEQKKPLEKKEPAEKKKEPAEKKKEPAEKKKEPVTQKKKRDRSNSL